jgi:HEAT repeat protein
MSITPESVEQLLNSEDFGERLRAVNQLRQLEPAIAYKLIQIAINDKNVRVRYAAVSQVSTLGTQNLPNALEVLRHSLHNDPEPDVQAAAADALGALKLTDALEDLQQVYSSTSEWLVQMSIVAALGEMGDPKAFPMLEHALTSENELIQTIAISALGELGDKRALPLLLPTLPMQIGRSVTESPKLWGGWAVQKQRRLWKFSPKIGLSKLLTRL